jgi:hypothetical protein
VKSLKELWIQILRELGNQCSVSTTRDEKTLTRRFEHEGLSFLTITLADFGSDFEKSLDQGHVGHDQFAGFSRTGGLPRFLGGFLDRVFDRCSGRLLDVPDVASLSAIRQLTRALAKIEIPCSDARVSRAILRYVECESDVKRNDVVMSPELLSEFGRMSLLLFGDVLSRVDLAVYNGDVVPKHGPGATADRLRGNSKFDLTEWTSRLERIFPYGDNAIPNWRFNYRLDDVDICEPRDERPVRVITVPKTLKTPRIIAIEPTCMQFMQQAVAEQLVRALETDKTVCGMVGFSDQTPNRVMAERGSVIGDLATLDLSEASDRVSNQHVRELLRHFPHLFEGVDATRSRKADVPGHGVIRLAKFASMGSALCFPIEAMVFTTITFMGIQAAQRRQFTRRDFKSYVGKVRIYGDDIIVPTDMLASVTSHLEAFGLKVNKGKTFGKGKFRESCGGDYYDGVDVTPVRVRHVLPTRRSDVTEVVAAVALMNRLYHNGLWESARWVRAWLKPLMGDLPRVDSSSPLLGWHSFLGYDSQRLNPSSHRPQVKGWRSVPVKPRSPISGEGALLKWFLKRGDEPIADREHLTRQGRPRAVYTKLRWASSV